MVISTLPLKRFAAIGLLAFCGFAGGCTSISEYFHNGFKVGPNYARPAAPVADDWIDSQSAARISSDSADYSNWWTVFNDPVLDNLIATAYSQNITLREAGYRVLEARAQRGIAVGNLFPQQQEAFGDYTRSARSLNTAGINTAVSRDAFPRYNSLYRLGGQAAWELDFWGRFRRAIEASDANLDAQIENYDDALVILLAETASTYMDVRTVEQRLEYARQNVVIQTESTRIANARREVNAQNSELDAPQARSNLAQIEAAIEELEISLRRAQNRLAVLMGMPPHDLTYLLGQPAPIPSAPQRVALGLPAELLRRRPDVRRAEREAAAQSAQIGIAETDLYPQISVTGSISLEAGRVEDLFKPGAFAGSVGPQFRWNVLNYGRLLNNIRVQDARFQQLVAAYQQSVLQANEEAENAITAYLHYHERVALLEKGEREASEAVRVASAKYQAGTVDYNRLFTVQQFLVNQQDQLAVARGNLATSLVELFRALGGGWEIRLSPLPPTQVVEIDGPELVPLPEADPPPQP